jgi:hypothetical protein
VVRFLYGTKHTSPRHLTICWLLVRCRGCLVRLVRWLMGIDIQTIGTEMQCMLTTSLECAMDQEGLSPFFGAGCVQQMPLCQPLAQCLRRNTQRIAALFSQLLRPA